MNKPRLVKAMEHIEDDLICDAIEYRPVAKKHFSWKTIAMVAACLALVLIIPAVHFLPDNTEPGNVNPSLFGEKTEEISWEDTTNISERYHVLQFSDYNYDTTTMCLDKNYVGELLGNAELKGQDGSGIEHVMTGKIYEISGISIDGAVAVTLDTEDIYFIYVNSLYRPDTLGDLIEDLNLETTLSVGKVTYGKHASNGEYVKVSYEGLFTADLFEILFVNPETVELVDNDDNMTLDKIMSIGVSVPAVGCVNRGIVLYESGYISTNILNTKKTFFVGEESVGALVDYVLQNCQESTAAQLNDENIAE